MRILLDTHFIVWLATEPHMVKPGELAVIKARRQDIVVSVIAFWEIRVKWESLDRRGNRRGTCDPAEAVSFVESSGFPVEVLTAEVAVEKLIAEIDHNDPFDRMLLVHAQHLGARLLTRDRRLIAHPLSLPL